MIFIAGGTGFVGHHLLESLKEKTDSVRCLVRSDRKADWVKSLGFEAVVGDISDRVSLQEHLDGVETVVNLVGIIREDGDATFERAHVEGTRNLVNESLAVGVEQFFYQSALGADVNSSYKYCKTKALAEEIVRSSGIAYAIFRPSLIIGKGDGFTERMKMLLTAGPVVPIPGKGQARFQPLSIRDWIQCFHSILNQENFQNRTYELGGPEQLTYLEILEQIMKALRLQKPIVHLPVSLTRLSLPFMGLIRPLASALGREIPELTGELLSLLDEDNVCEIDSIQKNFGFEPQRLSETLKEFLGDPA
jgi:uncharacterized protein YbjT (DUF2867 family)